MKMWAVQPLEKKCIVYLNFLHYLQYLQINT